MIRQRQAILIVPPDNIFQRCNARRIQNDLRAKSREFVIAKHHAQPQAGWAAAVSHGLTQIEIMRLAYRPVGREDSVDESFCP